MKKRLKQASRLDNFADIGDVGDLDAVSKIVSGEMRNHGGDSDDEAGSAMASALQSLGAAAAGSGGGGKAMSAALKRTAAAMQSADARSGGATASDKRRRRPAPTDEPFDNGMDDSVDVDPYSDLLEDFAQKKRDFLQQKKQDRYTPEARYGGIETTVGDGEKRAVSYEIIKNRGLTPHRKKANRNPRVKKREAYSKALVRRKGQVREVITGAAGKYSGEMTGIKANVARSRKIGI